MKTTEQNKSEVINYLNKTSNHLFITTKGEHYKVLLEGDNLIVIKGDSVSVSNINDTVNYYGNNAKCVIKHQLFLIPSYTSLNYPATNSNKLKSIKQNKTFRENFSKIKELISGKTDKNEIKKIITDHIKGVEPKEESKGFFNKIFGK